MRVNLFASLEDAPGSCIFCLENRADIPNPGIGIGIGVAIEMAVPSTLDSDADSDTDRDGYRRPLPILFMRLGAPPAHGGLLRK
jgi:hypothetical protein